MVTTSWGSPAVNSEMSAQKLGLVKREARPVELPLSYTVETIGADGSEAGRHPLCPRTRNRLPARSLRGSVLALPQHQSTPSGGPGTRPPARQAGTHYEGNDRSENWKRRRLPRVRAGRPWRGRAGNRDGRRR